MVACSFAQLKGLVQGMLADYAHCSMGCCGPFPRRGGDGPEPSPPASSTQEGWLDEARPGPHAAWLGPRSTKTLQSRLARGPGVAAWWYAHRDMPVARLSVRWHRSGSLASACTGPQDISSTVHTECGRTTHKVSRSVGIWRHRPPGLSPAEGASETECSAPSALVLGGDASKPEANSSCTHTRPHSSLS